MLIINPFITIIAAYAAHNRCIGKNNQLPFRLPQDMKRFKEITMGKPIIMGRKTYESIGKPLSGRENIIISRNMSTAPDGFRLFNELEEGLKYACAIKSHSLVDKCISTEVMIIGGAEIYAQTIGKAQRMHITEVGKEVKEGDAFFPEYDISDWKMVDEEEEYVDNGINCVYKQLEHKSWS